MHTLTSAAFISSFSAQQSVAAVAAGKDDSSPANDGNTTQTLTLQDVAQRLNQVPTFAIVDRSGVPYTVVGEDAKVTAYFFTSFLEADRILKVARESSDKERKRAMQIMKLKQSNGEKVNQEELDDVKVDPWDGARISTVPLDFAISLTFKSKPGLYFKLSPAEVRGSHGNFLCDNCSSLYYMYS